MRLTAQQAMRIMRIINAQAFQNRAQLQYLDKLAAYLEFTDEEKAAMQYQELPSRPGVFAFDGAYTIEREIPDDHRHQLLQMVENAPAEVPWRREERALFYDIIEALGGEAG